MCIHLVYQINFKSILLIFLKNSFEIITCKVIRSTIPIYSISIQTVFSLGPCCSISVELSLLQRSSFCFWHKLVSQLLPGFISKRSKILGT